MCDIELQITPFQTNRYNGRCLIMIEAILDAFQVLSCLIFLLYLSGYWLANLRLSQNEPKAHVEKTSSGGSLNAD